MSGRVFGYTFGRVPTWLLDEPVPDRAVRLFALLTRYADQEGRGYPGRRTLAERLRCSVDSVDRALRDLVDAGAVRVVERWDGDGDGGQLTNDYHLLEHRDPGRTGAAPPAAPVRLPPAAPVRPRREREPEEREPGVNETPLPSPRAGGRVEVVMAVEAPACADDVVAAWATEYQARTGQRPTARATRQLGREAGRLLAEGRSPDIVTPAALLLVRDGLGPRLLEGRVDRLLVGSNGEPTAARASSNPIDARIRSSLLRAQGAGS